MSSISTLSVADFREATCISPSRTCQQRLLRSVLVPPKSTCTTVRVSDCCRVFKVLHTERCAVFLSPRVQLNFHVAQTSISFVGVRSPRSGGMLPWSPTGLFRSNAAQLHECGFARGQHGFHTAVGALVLICFVAPCRYDLLRALLTDPAAELIDVAVLIASWLSHRGDTNRLFGTTSPRQLHCNGGWYQPGAFHGQRNKQSTYCDTFWTMRNAFRQTGCAIRGSRVRNVVSLRRVHLVELQKWPDLDAQDALLSAHHVREAVLLGFRPSRLLHQRRDQPTESSSQTPRATCQ